MAIWTAKVTKRCEMCDNSFVCPVSFREFRGRKESRDTLGGLRWCVDFGRGGRCVWGDWTEEGWSGHGLRAEDTPGLVHLTASCPIDILYMEEKTWHQLSRTEGAQCLAGVPDRQGRGSVERCTRPVICRGYGLPEY